ncbi:colanic acid biosynthesis acetyltransferase [Neorhizobium sp. NCHU2750]|nr:colanic acid biosynthesis acetyltransferase [Neorhizobium sp. NCHU2750]
MSLLDAKLSNPREGGPSFSLRHRIVRFVWALIWGAFGNWTPVYLYAWRRFLLRVFGARIHKTAKVYPGVRVWYPANLTMNEYSCLASGVNCYCMDQIEIGSYALVSQGAHLCGGTHDIDDPHFQLVAKPIVIGRNAWIAAEAFVGPGVTVGEGAVIGARAVAFRPVEPFAVYAGNPAKLNRMRKINGVIA